MIDKPTLNEISKLHPSVRVEVAKIIEECNSALTSRSQVRISQGYRTFAEQDAIYAIGRTKPGAKVTNAKGGQSVHNYGLAVDIVLIIDGKTASWDTKADWDGDKQSDWMECVTIFKKNGWSWGGDWRTFKDMPHFEKNGYSDWRKMFAMSKAKDGYIIV